MTSGRCPRGLCGAAVAAAGCGPLLLISCVGGGKPATGVPSATMAAEATPPTATPRPANVVVEPEPSFTPDADAPRTLVLRSASTSLVVDTDSGAVREVMRAPAATDNSGYFYLSQFPFVFAPDGASYAFACDDSGGSSGQEYRNNLCVSRAGGTSADIVSRRDALEQFGAYPPSVITWSPDGRRIAFQKRNRDNAEVPDVYVVDLEARATTRVIANAGHEEWGPVSWSPDSTRFIIQRWPGRAFNLIVVDASTGDTRDLAQALAPSRAIPRFAWSPDGKRVAFIGVAATEGRAGLFVVNATDGAVRQIADGAIAGERPAWSPDGRWIAFTTDVRDPGTPYFRYRVFVVRADGSEERALPEVTDSTGPVWAPDSSHIALRGTLHGRAGVLVTSIRGATPMLISDQPSGSYPGFLVWSADGKRLFFIQGGSCGQGGCTPGFLYTAELENGATPRKLYDQPISDIISAPSD